MVLSSPVEGLLPPRVPENKLASLEVAVQNDDKRSLGVGHLDRL